MLSCYFIAGTQDCCHLPGETPEAKLLFALQAALSAGITAFQFREKGANALQNPARIAALAKQCRERCGESGVPFFVNDDVALACAVEADGIHVGQSDTPIEVVRKQCGQPMILGLSVNRLAEAQAACMGNGIAYFGVGPIFATTSKADAQAVTGTALLRQIRAAGIVKPLVAIGGITTANVRDVRAAGADGVAVISALTRSTDWAQTVRQLKGD